MFSEKIFEDIICKYPELIEDQLEYLNRQVTLYGRRIDILFEDKFKRKLLIELKVGPIKDQHIGQILAYEGMLLSHDDPTIRVMLVGNRVPPNLQKSLDHHGIAWKEISFSALREFLSGKKDESFLSLFSEDQTPVIKKDHAIDQQIQIKSGLSSFQQRTYITIYEQIKKILKNKEGSLVSPPVVKDLLYKKFGTNPDSVILSDYCYNRLNLGINLTKHLFQYIDKGRYKYLGEDYSYTGPIFSKSIGQKNESVVGKWVNGIKELNEITYDWPELDQSNYRIEYIFEFKKTEPKVQRFLYDFHNILTTELNRKGQVLVSRINLYGIAYFTPDRTFLWANVQKNFISMKYFTGNSSITGLDKANWIRGGDNMGSEVFRVDDNESLKKAIELALAAFEITLEWSKKSRKMGYNHSLSQASNFLYEYWKGLKEYMDTNNSFIKLRKPKARNWDDISIGTSDIYMSFAVNSQDNSLNIWLTFRGLEAKNRLRQLYRIAYNESLSKVNKDLVYDFMEGRQRCAVTLKKTSDFRNRKDWTNQFEWFKENLEKFDKFFRPLIKSV